MEDYKHHVHIVLEKLQEVELYAKLKKCDFHQSEMEIFKLCHPWRWHSHGFA
jgi:hypothetical protein